MTSKAATAAYQRRRRRRRPFRRRRRRARRQSTISCLSFRRHAVFHPSRRDDDTLCHIDYIGRFTTTNQPVINVTCRT